MNILYNLKIVYRNFINQRPYSFLNLAGLSIGLCIAFIALLYVTEETGYDLCHEKQENIYNLICKNTISNSQYLSFITDAHNVKKIKEKIPEIVTFVRTKGFYSKLNNVYETEGFYADPEIVDLFTFNLTNGDFESFKTNIETVIVSESFALKHFKTSNVIGQQLVVEGRDKQKINYTITAVYKDLPKKSSIRPQFILPIKKQIKKRKPNVTLYGFRTYLLLANNSNYKDIEAKIDTIFNNTYKLQPLAKTHLHSEDISGAENLGSIQVLIMYSLIAGLILIISLMNFLLLYTAITKRRFKEFAIRKVNGLSHLELLKIFLFEAVVISVISASIAFLLVDLCIPLFNKFTNSNLTTNWFLSVNFLIYAFGLVIMVSFLSGIKLHHYLTKYNSIDFLGKSKVVESNNFFLKNRALLIQISIVSFMFIFSVGYYKQLDFVLNSDKGYVPANVFVVPSLAINPEVFIQEAKKQSIIEDIAIGPSIPNWRWSAQSSIKMLDKPSKFTSMEYFNIDYNYIPLYQIKIKEGRNFSKEFKTDQKDAIILNEAAIKQLNIDHPIGKKTNLGTIIGVVEDFNFETFHKSIRPIIFKIFEDDGSSAMVIKYKQEKKEETAELIKTLLGNQNKKLADIFNNSYNKELAMQSGMTNEAYQKLYFDPDFMDTVMDNFYGSEKTLQKAILILTAIAIFITILGLIGMTLFKTQQKTKEIGIRKVNGATITEIMLMLNKDFIKWVFIAFIIACPIAYYAMSKWLENFAYKTPLSWWVFALAGVFTLVIALVTVSWQTYRAATRNPVESLRDE